MGTCNYITQDDFDLYTIEYSKPTQEEIENFMIETGEMFDEDFDCEMFYDNVSRDFTERWVNYDDILDMPPIYKLLNIYHSEELKALKNNEIDYIALSSDL